MRDCAGVQGGGIQVCSRGVLDPVVAAVRITQRGQFVPGVGLRPRALRAKRRDRATAPDEPHASARLKLGERVGGNSGGVDLGHAGILSPRREDGCALGFAAKIVPVELEDTGVAGVAKSRPAPE